MANVSRDTHTVSAATTPPAKSEVSKPAPSQPHVLSEAFLVVAKRYLIVLLFIP